MGLALQEMGAGVTQRGRQGLQRRVDQFLIAEVGERQRVGPPRSASSAHRACRRRDASPRCKRSSRRRPPT